MARALAGCTETKEVFVPFPLYEDPAAAAAGFLGYSDEDAKLPVCGNCHVGQYAEWKQTHHAGAWETLQESGSAQAFCEGCHTVGPNGNATDGSVGFAATGESRYHDVQCEACHGPGLEHVTNPDATQPYASIVVGTGVANSCGECHSGAHHPFVDQWEQSRHANTSNSASTREGCTTCHEARGALAAWGVKADYIEKNSTDVIPIVCAVCHDPHDATNEHQLRFPIDVPDIEVNLCMKCHQRRSEPDHTSTRGPHSPQGPLLVGEGVGWRPPNFQAPTAQIVGSHGTSRNPELCAGCHVQAIEVTDPATGGHVFSSKGHLFKAIPCLDAQGIPTTDDDCAETERDFSACSSGTCHGTPDVARNLVAISRQRLLDLAEEVLDLVAQAPASELVTNDDLITTAEGARFNAQLAEEFRGSAIHNPFLVEALLTASIRQLQTDYGLVPSADITLENILGMQ